MPRRRFDGHKAAIVVDTDTQLITAVEVLPGNAPDNLGALEFMGWATPPSIEPTARMTLFGAFFKRHWVEIHGNKYRT